MSNTRSRLILVVVFAVMIVLGVVFYLLHSAPNKSVSNGSSSSSSSSASSSGTGTTGNPADHPDAVPNGAINVVTSYISAQQDAVGADQSSPTSWIASVQSITTPSWFAELQPKQSSTGSTPNEYRVAHSNNYTVQASLSGCIWDKRFPHPVPTSGTIYCQLNDTTINQATGATVTGSSLPFGWSRTGSQSPVDVSVVQTNGNWLVSNIPAAQ